MAVIRPLRGAKGRRFYFSNRSSKKSVSRKKAEEIRNPNNTTNQPTQGRQLVIQGSASTPLSLRPPTQLRARETQLRARETQLRARETQIRARETQIRTRETQIRARETQIRTRETQIRTRETQIRARETQIRARETQIRARETQIRARETQIGACETQLTPDSGNPFTKSLQMIFSTGFHHSRFSEEARQQVVSRWS